MFAWIAWGALSRLWSTGRLWASLVPALLLAWVFFLVVADMVNTPRRLGWVLGALLAGMAVYIIIWFVTGSLFKDTFYLPSIGTGGLSMYGSLAGAIAACLLAIILHIRSPWRETAIVFALLVGYLLFSIGLRRSFLTTAAVLSAFLIFPRVARARGLVLTLAVLFLLYLAWSYMLPNLPEGVQERLTLEDVIETRATGRLDIWPLALNLWSKAPFTGVGLGDFGVYSRLSATVAYSPLSVHNMYLQVLVELGVVGFGLWIWGWANLVLSAARAYQASRTDSDRLLAAVPLALIVFFAAATLVDPFDTWRLMWLAFGLTIGAERVICGKAGAEDIVSPSQRLSRLSPRSQRCE